MKRLTQRGRRYLYRPVGGARGAAVVSGPFLAPLRSSHLFAASNGPLFQQRRCGGTLAQTSAATTAPSSSPPHTAGRDGGGDDDPSSSRPPPLSQEPRELHFHEDFLLSEADVHYLLLQEAHAKHGVLLNVPPQRSPDGAPPAVPAVLLPAAQVERMRRMTLAYEPTHLPPPLYTTGTRQLVVADVLTTSAGLAKKPATLATTATGSSGGGGVNNNNNNAVSRGAEKSGGPATTTLLRRLPPDPTMRFHCSACGKAFRLEFSADHHVKLKHGSDAAAKVVAGPGEGEIIGEAEATVAAPAHAVGTAAATTKAAVSSTSVGASDKKEGGKETPAAAVVEAVAPKTKVSGKAQQTGGGTSSVDTGGAKTLYDRATLTLPSEELVDDLLRDIWDSVAAQRDDVPKKDHPDAYVSFASVVEGKADRRKEMEANAKPLARATPEGAAPGIKKPGMLPGGAMIAQKNRAQGQILPIKELVKRYPNPFGDSPNAVLQELEKEPVNPFIPQEELATQLQVARERNDSHADVNVAGATVGDAQRDDLSEKQQEKLKAQLRASRPSLARSASLRRFACPFCAEKAKETCEQDGAEGSRETSVASFRLLDALLDHVESDHEGEELTEEQLRALYEIQRSSPLHGPVSSAQEEAKRAGGDVGGPRSDGDPTPLGAVKAASLPESLQSAAPPAAVEQKALSVHVRAGSNAVLLGRVADVQHGFLGAVTVTQYVLEVDGDDDDAARAEGDAKGPVKELVVVRCMGDNFPVALLKEQVKLGSTVLVQGTLRMNRHIDNASKRLHAYPFVQVVPPLGCVKVLG